MKKLTIFVKKLLMKSSEYWSKNNSGDEKANPVTHIINFDRFLNPPL